MQPQVYMDNGHVRNHTDVKDSNHWKYYNNTSYEISMHKVLKQPDFTRVSVKK